WLGLRHLLRRGRRLGGGHEGGGRLGHGLRGLLSAETGWQRLLVPSAPPSRPWGRGAGASGDGAEEAREPRDRRQPAPHRDEREERLPDEVVLRDEPPVPAV